jgi:hypothetical protein
MVKQSNIPIKSEVAAVFNSFARKIRPKIMFLRQLIDDTAASIEEI